MIPKLKVAVIQMAAGPIKEKNLRTALDLIRKAVRRRARFILLPEAFNFRGGESELSKNAETLPGPSLEPLQKIARQNKVWILAGSIGEKIRSTRKVYNSSVLMDDRGRMKAVYRKMHLFDVSLKDKEIFESKKVLRGSRPVLTSLGGIPLGLSVCYDLRVPELYGYYASKGAQILCIPSSFTLRTGKAHWEVLLRARAVENQCFVLAPNQYGVGSHDVRTYGSSMIIDPWGRVLARASVNRQEILYADLDFRDLNKIRKNLPSLEERLRFSRLTK